MPRWLLLLALACAACEGTKVRLFNPHPQGTPAWHYDEAFMAVRRDHRSFQRLPGAPPGQIGATMDDILRNLERMRDLLEEPFRAELLPLIAAHERVKTEFVDRGSMSAGVFRRMEELEKDVEARFYPEHVTLKGSAAGAPASPAPPAASSGPAASPAAPRGWMAPAAWRQVHAELLAAFPDRPEDAAAAYARVREAADVLKAGASEDAAAQLQIYLNEYERLAAATGNFSKIPVGRTADDVKKALGAVGRGVEGQIK